MVLDPRKDACSAYLVLCPLRCAILQPCLWGVVMTLLANGRQQGRCRQLSRPCSLSRTRPVHCLVLLLLLFFSRCTQPMCKSRDLGGAILAFSPRWLGLAPQTYSWHRAPRLRLSAGYSPTNACERLSPRRPSVWPHRLARVCLDSLVRSAGRICCTCSAVSPC